MGISKFPCTGGLVEIYLFCWILHYVEHTNIPLIVHLVSVYLVDALIVVRCILHILSTSIVVVAARSVY